MAIAYRTSSSALLATSASTTQTLTLPSGIQQNDIILWYLSNGEDSPQPTITSAPSGYTQRGSGVFVDYGTGGVTGTLWWKIAGASESDPSVTWNTGNSNGGGLFALCIVYSGVDTSSPFALSAVSEGTSGPSGSLSLPNVTTTSADAMLVSFVQSSDDNTITLLSASGFTQRVGGDANWATTVGSDASVAVADRLVTTATTYTPCTWTSVASDTWGYQTIGLKPAAATFSATQAAFRFYEDGTESGSTAIDAQNTNISRDVTSNTNLALRVRLQETGGSAGAGTDDYQLQYRINAGSWTNTGTGAVLNHASANLTDGGATTNRLGAGTGSFVAGEISEDGLVDDHQITASNYTEHLYALTLASGSTSAGDSIEFRVLRNGATTNMTYTVTPTVTVLKTVAKSGTDSTLISSSETSDILATVAVSSSDSTQISSSETSDVVPSDAGVITEEETFESATSGDLLTVGTIVDAQATPGSSTATISTANPLHGSKHARLYGASAQSRAAVNIGTTQSLVYARMYIYWDTMPTANNTIMLLYDTVAGTTIRAGVQITTGGSIRIRNGLTAVSTGTYAFSANTWYRMEWKVDYANTTQELRVWTGVNLESTNAADAVELTTGNKFLSGTMNTGTFERFGFGPNETPGANVNYDIDTVAYGSSDWIGPYSSGGPTPITGSDSTLISSSETSSFAQVDFTRTDTTDITSAETASIQSTLNRTDSTEISSSETSSFATSTFTRTDTTDITSTEGRTLQSTLSRTDTTDITSTESRTLDSTLSRTDSTDITSSETSSIVVLVSASDSTQVSSTETSDILSTLSRADTTDISSTESRSFETVAFTRTDTTEITGTDAGVPLATFPGTDATLISSSETSEIIPSGEFQITSDDTTQISTSGVGTPATVRSVASAAIDTQTLTVAAPAGMQVGDTEILIHHWNRSRTEPASVTGSSSTGWTRLISTADYTPVGLELVNVWYRIVPSGENTTSLTLAPSNFAEQRAVRMAFYSTSTLSVNTTKSISVFENDADGIYQTPTASGIAEAVLLHFATLEYELASATLTTDGALTEVYNSGYTNARPFIAVGTETISGNTSARSFTLSATGNDGYTGLIRIEAAGAGETSEIVSFLNRPDTTQITSTETSSFAQVNFSTTDTTSIGSTETSSILVTQTRTDSTDITSSETSAIQSTLSRADTTDITSAESRTISSTLSRTDTTDITSAETRTISSTLSRSDTTDISSSETSSFGQVNFTRTDSTDISSSETSSLAITTQISSSDSTEISSSETSQVDLGGTQLIRHHERFNGGADGVAMTSGNTLFTLFPGTGTMEFSNDHPIQGGTGGLFVSTTAAQGKRGKIEGLVSRRTWYARFYYYKTGNPSAVNRFMIFETAANANPPGDDIAGIREEGNGNLTLFNGSSWVTGTPISSLANGWHRIEMKVDRDGTLSTLRVWSGANMHSTGTADQEIQVSLTDNGNEISVVGIGNYNAVNHTRYIEDFAVGDQDWIGPSADIELSATDSTEISSTDTSAITVPITSADTTLVSSTETSAIVSSLTRPDTTEISSTDSSGQQITLSRTDTTDITSTESSALQSNLSRADTTDVTSAETGTIQSTVSRTDTTDITSADSGAIQSTLSRTDSTNITSAETSSFGQVNFSASDSTQISSAETSAPVADFPGTDTTLISSSETSDVQISGDFPVAGTDSTDISSSETSSVLVIVNTSDTTSITSAESSSFATVAFTRTDSTDITSSETSQFATVVRSATDSTEITGSDSSSFGQVNFTRTDSTNITSSETSSFGQVNFSTSDTTQITSAETSTPLADFPGTDTTLVSSSETSDVQVSGGFNLSSDDTTNITSSETSSVLVIVTTTDTTSISSAESASSSGTMTSSDSTSITSTDSSSFGQINFSASDSTQISSTDAGQPVANFPGTDTTLISSSETSDVQISGGSNISSNDSTAISSAETNSLVITAFITGTDSTSITSSDASSFGQVNFTSTDTTQITSTESATPVASLPGSDATLLSSSETSDVQVSGAFDLSTSDTTSITSSETSSVIATVAVSSADSTSITSSESSSFAQVNFTRTDTTNITSTESTEFYRWIDSTDATQITSADSGTPVANFPGTDSTLIGSSETSQIDLVGNVPVSTTDSTDISSSETSAVLVTVGRADATQITSTETSASSGTMTSSDSTQITSTESIAFNDQDINSTDSVEITTTETSDIFILVAITSSDSTEISSTETAIAAGYKAGEVASEVTTDLPGRGTSSGSNTEKGVSSSTRSSSGVSSR